MKKIILTLILGISLSLFSQTNIILKNSWLQAGYSYTLHTSQRMQTALPDLTANPINLNISDCISNMQSGNVMNQEIFGIDNAQPNGIDWMLDYNTAFTYYELNIPLGSEAFGATGSNPMGDSYTGRYYNVSIVLNSNAGTPWNSNGNVDINTVLRHEIGHLYGLSEYRSMVNNTLMNPYDIALVQSLGQNDINGFRIVFEAPTTTIDSGSVILSGNNFLYRINFPVIEAGPDFGEIPEGFGFHSYLYKDGVLQSTEPLIPTFVSIDGDGNKLYTNSIDTSTLELGNYSVRTYSAMFWNQAGDVALYETHDRPYSNISFKVVAKPTIPSPIPGEIKYVRPSGEKGAVTDSILIKVKVPVVLGAYPEINIKIDGTYVSQSEIFFDTVENVWVYDWDLGSVTPTIYGKKYNIIAEIDGDPTDRAVTSVFLVEGVFHEDFQTVTNLETAGWVITEYAYPPASQAANGWMIGPDPLYVVGNKCGRSYSTYSTAFTYKLYTPTFTVPDSSIIKTKLKYRIYYKKVTSPNSYIYFDVCNAAGTPLTTTQMLGPTYNLWIDINYDLSNYSGQTIKLRWNHSYAGGSVYCNSTNYALDDILVYTLPDTNAPLIDFFAGNSAELNEDMNLSLGFNDDSEVGDVTADYTIDGESGSVTLNPPKYSYTYTGIIPAKDHACSGTIVFKVTDSVGNETISSPYGIYWAEGGGILTAPENVVITQPTSTTVSITWDLVPGATSYKVFSSTDPYGTFIEDTTGTFTESRVWQKTIDGNKYFYCVVAVSAVKKEEYEISIAGEDK